MEKKRNYKKIIIIILIIALLIGAGVFVYFKFFKPINTDYYSVIFKTDDGKKLDFCYYSEVEQEIMDTYKNRYMKICEENNTNYDLSYCDDVKNDKLDEFDYKIHTIFPFDHEKMKEYAKYSKITSGNGFYSSSFYAKFDGKLIAIYEGTEGTRYGYYAGNDLSKDGQLPFDYYFLIDYKTKKVLQYDEEIAVISHYYDKDEERKNATFFAKKEKNSFEYKVFTTEFKYLGNILTIPDNMIDDDGYVYVIDDGIITKYDEKGNKAGSLPKFDKIIDYTIFNNICLALIYENNNLYLYDYSDNSRVKLTVKINNVDNVTLNDIIANCFFLNDYQNLYNNEVVIFGGAGEKSSTVWLSSLGYYSIYDYKLKSFKKTEGSEVYSNDKTFIELKETSSTRDDDGNEIKEYDVYDGSKEFSVKVKKDDIRQGILIIKHKASIYIIDTYSKKLITKYTAKKEVDYNNEESEYSEDVQRSYEEWYIIYNGNKFEGGKIVAIANRSNGEILTSNNNYPVDYIIKNDQLYVAYSNKLVKYSSDGKVLKTINYDKIITDYEDSLYSACILKNKNYYLLEFDKDVTETLLSKIGSYTNDNETILIYKDSNDTQYILYKNHIYENNNSNDKRDDNYAVYWISDGSMCGNNVLVNKKNNKIVKMSQGDLGFIKTNNGYFFTEASCISLDPISYVYTTDWNIIGPSFLNDPAAEDGVYVNDDGYIKVFDINGNEVRKSAKKYEFNAGIQYEKNLYIIQNDNNVSYLVKLDKSLNEIATINICSKELNNGYIEYYEEDKEIIVECYSDDHEKYKQFDFNPNTQELTEIKEDE